MRDRRPVQAPKVLHLETSVDTGLPPDNIETFCTYANGGGGNSDVNRSEGGPSTAAKINDTVVIVSGGGGGGGPVTSCSGKDGATLQIGEHQHLMSVNATATASEWPNRPTGGGGEAEPVEVQPVVVATAAAFAKL